MKIRINDIAGIALQRSFIRLIATLLVSLHAPILSADIQSTTEFRSTYSTTDVATLILGTANADRFSHLELALRFSTGRGGINQSTSGALRQYALASQIPPQHGLTIDRVAVPVIRASRSVIEVIAPLRPVAIINMPTTILVAPVTLELDSLQSTTAGAETYVAWQWSDAAGQFIFGSPTASRSYADAATVDVLLGVMDSKGRVSTDTTQVTIAPPVIETPNSPIILSPLTNTELGLHEAMALTWEIDTGAQSYQITVFNALGDTIIHDSLTPNQLTCPSGECRWGYNKFVTTGPYTVSIAAQNIAGVSDTASAHFDVLVQPGSDLCAGMPVDTGARIIEDLSAQKPALLTPFSDPAFGASVTRITDSPFGIVNKPAYSTVQAWNADESLLLLYRTGGSDLGHYLHDGQTYAEIGKLDISPSDIEEIFWSHSDPDMLFYAPKVWARRGEFVQYKVSTGEELVLRTFTEQCPDNQSPFAGGDVQMQSYDDDLFAFRCGSGTAKTMFRYRISSDEVVQQPLGDNSPWIPWNAPNPLPLGDGFFINGSVLEENLLTQRSSLDLANPNEHSSLGLNHQGQNALYQTAFNASPAGCDGDSSSGIGHLIEHNFDAGTCRGLVTQSQGYPYTTSGTHVSALAYKRPGWVALSSGSHANLGALDGTSAAPVLLSEIYLVNTDPNNAKVCRLAHHRSYGAGATNGGYLPYFAEPHVTLSPSGTRLLFGSDWYDSGAVDTYVIELPEFLAQ